MRVLLVPYPGTFELVGGHVTQQLETARALERAGIDATVGTIDEAIAGAYDVVHAFGDIRPLLARGRPAGRLVASPIYFPARVLLGPSFRRAGLREQLRRRAGYGVRRLRDRAGHRVRLADVRAMHEGWRQADVVVVNSRAEGRLLQVDAPGFDDVRVAYSGVSRDAFGGDAEHGRRILGLGDEPFVLSVARVEPIKNHLSLALAMQRLPYRLVLVGAVLPGNESYFGAVRRALPDVVHLPHVDHAQLKHVHAAATVHALPSWYETTGLSTLEAFAAGRPAVVSGGPCVTEYFASCAAFCNAARIGSIRAAIERAAAGAVGCETDLAARFNWDETARQLIEAYSG